MELEIFSWKKLEVELQPKSEAEEIAQNVLTILKTAKGTVPFDREFGISDKLLDQPENIVRAKLTAEIADAISKYEPRARLVSCKFRGNLDGRLEPMVKIKLVEKNLRGGLK